MQQQKHYIPLTFFLVTIFNTKKNSHVGILDYQTPSNSLCKHNDVQQSGRMLLNTTNKTKKMLQKGILSGVRKIIQSLLPETESRKSHSSHLNTRRWKVKHAFLQSTYKEAASLSTGAPFMGNNSPPLQMFSLMLLWQTNT